MGKEGLKIVILIRFFLVFFFNLLNYVYGIINVFLKDYVIGFLGMIFGIIMYVYIGFLVGSLVIFGMVIN